MQGMQADGARATAFVDNTLRDVRFALRSFRRAPLSALMKAI